MPKKPANRALHDAADARNVRDLLLGGNDRTVAGGRADHLDERAFAYAAPDRAVVDVELADRDRNAWLKPELRRPFRAQRPGRLGCIIRFFVKAVPEFGEMRVELP